MYSYHLWILLRESTREAEESSLIRKLDQLKAVVAEKLRDVVPEYPIHPLNYEHLLQGSVSHNRRGDSHDRMLSVLAWIADELPGSYGLVYWYDDEVPGRSFYDGYNVIVIARGSLMHRHDPFLSPVAPVVED
ncbi:MAG TPA: Imm7 family immunity protein [Thermoanaerobaculia bacterium]|jgi:hypothetical protein|nr:Imm7 family immunity protein [Thermoanaerobaculia bacterium]